MQPRNDNSHQHPHSAKDFIADLKNWWNTCPLFTRFLLCACSAICFLGLFSNIGYLLVNVPKYTLGEFEISRLIFSPFTSFAISELICGFIAYIPISTEKEKAHGTVKAALDFLLKNLELNILFILICYILSIIYSGFKEFDCYGLWGPFFIAIIEKCLANPDGNVDFLGSPLHVKARYYPLILIILFSVISDVIRFDFAVAILVGYLNYKYLNAVFDTLLDDAKVSQIEQTAFMAWIKTLPHFAGLGGQHRALMDSFDHGPGRAYEQNNLVGFNKGRPQGQEDIEDLSADAEEQCERIGG